MADDETRLSRIYKRQLELLREHLDDEEDELWVEPDLVDLLLGTSHSEEYRKWCRGEIAQKEKHRIERPEDELSWFQYIEHLASATDPDSDPLIITKSLRNLVGTGAIPATREYRMTLPPGGTIKERSEFGPLYLEAKVAVRYALKRRWVESISTDVERWAMDTSPSRIDVSKPHVSKRISNPNEGQVSWECLSHDEPIKWAPITKQKREHCLEDKSLDLLVIDQEVKRPKGRKRVLRSPQYEMLMAWVESPNVFLDFQAVYQKIHNKNGDRDCARQLLKRMCEKIGLAKNALFAIEKTKHGRRKRLKFPKSEHFRYFILRKA